MKKIKGLICVIKDKKCGRFSLFGKSSKPQIDCEALETNGILPFTNMKAVKEAADQLRNRFPKTRISLARLKMEIAETEKDLLTLENQKGKKFIVIMKGDEFLKFFGRLIEGSNSGCGYLPASDLRDNKLKPFLKYGSAEYAAQEIRRQGGCHACIATFSLKILSNQ